MTTHIVDGLPVTAPNSIGIDEVKTIIAEERLQWQATGKEPGRCDIYIDGEYVCIKTVEKSPVRRVRRICGYLTQMENFNDAKKAELKARRAHYG